MANSLYRVNENKQLVPINWMPFKQMTKAEIKALTNPLPAGTIVNVTDSTDEVKDIPYTLADGISGRFNAKQYGKMVQVSFDVNLPSSYTTDSALTFGTISKKPIAYVIVPCMRGVSSATGVACRFNVDTNGNMLVYCPSQSNGALRGSFTYLTE